MKDVPFVQYGYSYHGGDTVIKSKENTRAFRRRRMPIESSIAVKIDVVAQHPAE